ncbi:GNAT family N-acetyltransferase [Plantibacter sp. YIM 135249]|uniref:GNAT family N-acetyltransferase n=1 Tax=Plantibacter sp. YIM 135249 TaxID=3423918 RepID=UPI003D341438
MDILTDRLILHPITPVEAQRIIAQTPAAHDRWHPEYPLGDELGPLRGLAVLTDPHPFFTLYAIQTFPEGLSIGGIGFFGPPDEEGRAELGYGLVESVRGSGLAAEALRALTDAAFRTGAHIIEADTAVENIASQRVLLNVGFREVRRTDDSVFFELR